MKESELTLVNFFSIWSHWSIWFPKTFNIGIISLARWLSFRDWFGSLHFYLSDPRSKDSIHNHLRAGELLLLAGSSYRAAPQQSLPCPLAAAALQASAGRPAVAAPKAGSQAGTVGVGESRATDAVDGGGAAAWVSESAWRCWKRRSTARGTLGSPPNMGVCVA